jgi:hypothetical protein
LIETESSPAHFVIYTFADECIIRVVVANTSLYLLCTINRLVLGELIKTDVIDQLLDLLRGHWLVEESGNSLDLSPDVLILQFNFLEIIHD